jgi:hypothetical protein
MKVKVRKYGMVHAGGVRDPIGKVSRLGKSWLAYNYGQSGGYDLAVDNHELKTRYHDLRCDAVAWVVAEYLQSQRTEIG